MKTKRDALFDTYISYDEKILWVGRPNPRQLFALSDLYMIPFSLLWGGFAITWEISALSIPDLLFRVWGIPFVIVGQYMIWGRFIHKYLKRRNTYYALTDRRALVLTRFFGTDLKTYFLHQLTSLQRKGQSVLFDLPESSAKPRRNQPDWLGEAKPGFYALADADDVYHIMQNLIVSPKAKNV